MVPITSLDGNSIYGVAKELQLRAIREMQRNTEEIREKQEAGIDTGLDAFIEKNDEIEALAHQLKAKVSQQRQFQL